MSPAASTPRACWPSRVRRSQGDRCRRRPGRAGAPGKARRGPGQAGHAAAGRGSEVLLIANAGACRHAISEARAASAPTDLRCHACNYSVTRMSEMCPIPFKTPSDFPGSAKGPENLESMAIDDRSLRVDPVAYAWGACNPDKPLPNPLGRLSVGTAIVQSAGRLSDPSADTRLARNSMKQIGSAGKLWTPQEIRQLSCLSREVTAEAAAAALRRTLSSVKMKALKTGISFRKTQK